MSGKIKIQVNIGDKFTNWTIIENVGFQSGHIKFLVECSCVNKTRKILPKQTLISEKSKSCGCLYNHNTVSCKKSQRCTDLTKKYPEKNNRGRSKSQAILSSIRNRAKDINVSYELKNDLETFETFCLNSCFYCGFIPKWPETHNGIDRIDSYNGYVSGNVVSCCAICNMSKNSDNIDYFKIRIIKLYENFIQNKESEWTEIFEFNPNFENKNIINKKYPNKNDIAVKYPNTYGIHTESHARRVWNNIKSGSKDRARKNGLKYDLSDLKSFEMYILGTCFYCKIRPNFPYSRNGIDRVDSSKGYTENNCVSCCFFCNRSKLDYTLEQFKEWIIRIYTHMTTVGWNLENNKSEINSCQ